MKEEKGKQRKKERRFIQTFDFFEQSFQEPYTAG